MAIYNESASNALALSSAVDVNFIIEAVVSTLTLTDAASNTPIRYETGVSDILFVQAVAAIHPIPRSLVSGLSFSQAVDSSIKPVSALSEIVFTQSGILKRPIFVATLNTLTGVPEWDDLENVDLEDPDAVLALMDDIGLRHAVSVNKTLNISASNTISFGQDSGPAVLGIASSYIGFATTARPVEYEQPSNELVFLQSAVANVTEPSENTLDLSSVVDGDLITNPLTASTLTLSSFVNVFKVNKCDYGLNGDENAPIDSTEPTITHLKGVVLSYGSTTVTLPSPQWDNSEIFEFRRINRRTRGGTIRVFRDSAWPKTEKLQMSFHAVTPEIASSLLNFLHASVGKQVGLRDFESRNWIGLIRTPTLAIQETSSVGSDFSLEFEGVQV